MTLVKATGSGCEFELDFDSTSSDLLASLGCLSSGICLHPTDLHDRASFSQYWGEFSLSRMEFS